jgi:hypothetical protein
MHQKPSRFFFSIDAASPVSINWPCRSETRAVSISVTMSSSVLAAALIVARAIQGFANGMAIRTLDATILDTDKQRAPVLNTFKAFAGLSAGTLGAGSLITPSPAFES